MAVPQASARATFFGGAPRTFLVCNSENLKCCNDHWTPSTRNGSYFSNTGTPIPTSKLLSHTWAQSGIHGCNLGAIGVGPLPPWRWMSFKDRPSCGQRTAHPENHRFNEKQTNARQKDHALQPLLHLPSIPTAMGASCGSGKFWEDVSGTAPCRRWTGPVQRVPVRAGESSYRTVPGCGCSARLYRANPATVRRSHRACGASREAPSCRSSRGG